MAARPGTSWVRSISPRPSPTPPSHSRPTAIPASSCRCTSIRPRTSSSWCRRARSTSSSTANGSRLMPAISCACRAASRTVISTNPTGRPARCSGSRRCRSWRRCSTSSTILPTPPKSCASRPCTRSTSCRPKPTTRQHLSVHLHLLAAPPAAPCGRTWPLAPKATPIASKSMVSPKHVCVIGAGVSGLAAAKAFSARGHRVTIVERSADLGGVWEPARSYPDVQTQSPKDLYRYTNRAMPDAYPEWPTGPQVHAYLNDYANSFGLDRMLRLNTVVAGMARRAGGRPGWTLALSGKDGTTTNEDFDFVAVCTGQFNEPRELHCPGEDGFLAQGGQILHSS